MGRKAKKITIESCIDLLSEEFDKFLDPRSFHEIALHDFLMCGLAMFSLKYPSLLSFEKGMMNTVERQNLINLFKVKSVPSDTQLRDILDKIDSKSFRIIFKKLFSMVQRTKLLESFEFLNINNVPHYLLSGDGTAYFRSDKVGCLNCNNYKGTEKRKMKKFGHNMFAASLVHPDKKEVIPLCPEPIIVQDGKTKNDCEQNAFKRFIKDFRREHPKLGAIMSLDALFATEPPIQLMFKKDISFIIVVKDTKSPVFRQVNDGEKTGRTKTHEYSYEIGDKVKKQVIHRYRYISNVHLNQDPTSTKVNFVEFWEEINWEGKRGRETKKVHFSWITDIKLNQKSIIDVMRGGRARWKIENETFNTLKNQGYNLEHNYGHGSDNLSVNFIMLMFLAFFVDQLQQAGCQTFKKALGIKERKSYLWKTFQSLFCFTVFSSWEQFFGLITKDWRIERKLYRNSS